MAQKKKQHDEIEQYVARQMAVQEFDFVTAQRSITLLVKITRIHYIALIEAGFTEEQALRIILAHGYWPKMPPPAEQRD